MLARVVENVYWLARYLERVENTARLVSVNTNLLLDLPKGLAPGWQPLIDITGSRAMFDARGSRADEQTVGGYDPLTPNTNPSGFRARTSVLGDIVDSSPTWVGPPAVSFPETAPSTPSCASRIGVER